jgi:hypothetical protein
MPSRAPRPEPIEQLRRVHDELNLQRSSVSVRARSLQDQATVLIGAAGVSVGIQLANLPVWAQWLVVLPSLAGAALAAISVRAAPALEVDITLLRNGALTIDAYSAEYGLVTDKIVAHELEVGSLSSRRRLVASGFLCLAGSWGATILIFALKG